MNMVKVFVQTQTGQQLDYPSFHSWTELDMFVKYGCPRQQQSQTMAKISKSYILTPPHPGACVSGKCKQPLDELTVQVWLLYDHPNFKYCTLFISGRELPTDIRLDGKSNRLTDKWSKHWMPPVDLSGWGHKKISLLIKTKVSVYVKVIGQHTMAWTQTWHAHNYLFFAWD